MDATLSVKGAAAAEPELLQVVAAVLTAELASLVVETVSTLSIVLDVRKTAKLAVKQPYKSQGARTLEVTVPVRPGPAGGASAVEIVLDALARSVDALAKHAPADARLPPARVKAAIATVTATVAAPGAIARLTAELPALERANARREAQADEDYRRAHPRPANRPFAGIRVTEAAEVRGALAPNVFVYGALFEALLREAGLRCPYDEIFVRFVRTREEIEPIGGMVSTANGNTHVFLDYDAYAKESPAARRDRVREAFAEALDRLADVDGWDRACVAAVDATLRSRGPAIDLPYLSTESATHRAALVYQVAEGNSEPAIRLTVTDKHTGATVERALGNYGLWSLPHFMAKLTLVSGRVRITAGTSARAVAAVGKAARVMEFAVTDLAPQPLPKRRPS